MVSTDTTEEPAYLGNLLFLMAAFFVTVLATATVVSVLGVEGVVAYAVAAIAFVAAFFGLLAFYNYYYLAN
ncbi:hypothetical protein [Natronococcus wangiae]|uniref:hypothetical protein n=1 Tax=Natronococcus wangiae TaxID=3068275 RepID=UPI00273E99EB|nr:hypothetical protein [Natronococcus sp. AD5]